MLKICLLLLVFFSPIRADRHRRELANSAECDGNYDCISDCCIFTGGKGICVGKPSIGQVCGLNKAQAPSKETDQNTMVNQVKLSPLVANQLSPEVLRQIVNNPTLLKDVLEATQMQHRLRKQAQKNQQLRQAKRVLASPHMRDQLGAAFPRFDMDQKHMRQRYSNLFHNNYEYGRGRRSGSSFSGYDFGKYVIGR